jgi:hypothetical protein
VLLVLVLCYSKQMGALLERDERVLMDNHKLEISYNDNLRKGWLN